MNSARVYKRYSVISKNECVPIPADNMKHETINHTTMPKEDISTNIFSDESNNTGIIPSEAGTTGDVSAHSGESTISEATEHKAKLKDLRIEADIKNIREDRSNTERTLDKEALLVIYKKELEELAKAEAESAYIDALNKKKPELKECISNVQKILEELIQKHDEFMEQYTNELKYMAIDIAEKMLIEKINADDAILQKLVIENLRHVKNAQWISIELSNRLVGLVDSIKEEIERSEYKGKTSVIAVADKKDTCRITTEAGTIDSTIRVQAENLRKAFREEEPEL